MIKSHPDINESSAFDALVDELSRLKGMKNLDRAGASFPAGPGRERRRPQQEFAKLVRKDKVDGFHGTRGRRMGYRPNGNGR